MHSMTDVALMIKRAAAEERENSNPTAVLYGTVTSATPLKVRVDQKKILDDDFLLLTGNVRDYEVEMEMEHQTEDAGGHSHSYQGKKKFKILNALKPGEKVILIQEQGGQRYIILDRVEAT